MSEWIRNTGIGAACLALLACTTLQPMTNDAATLQQMLHPGDRVELTTTSGEALRFKLTEVDDRGLHGEGHDVPYRDIGSISRSEMAGGRTALLVLGVIAVGAAAAGGGGHGGGGGMGGGGGGY
jgi:hypothetical protein